MTYASAILFAGFSVWMCLPEVALAFTSRKGARVNPVSTEVFEVVPTAGGTGMDYWCGAGDYAMRALDAPLTDMVYVYRGLGPSETSHRRSAVQFTLNAVLLEQEEAGQGAAALNRLRTGDAMRIRSALGYCHQLPEGF